MGDDKYDKRIVMSSTYVPPLPKSWGKKPRRWPKQLAILVVVCAAMAVGGLFGAESWLGRDPRLPRIWRITDYHPKVVTRLLSANGEPIGEIVGERRTVVSSVSPLVRRAVVLAREPDYFDRERLGRMDFLRALVHRVDGEPEPPSIVLSLARSLTRELPDRGWIRFAKEWLVALRLERRLSREDVLSLYLNEVSFGRGVFGVEEGARAHVKLGADKLDAKQAAVLAKYAESNAAIAFAPPAARAPEHAALVEAELMVRYDDDGLQRLGATVTTTCDLALTQKIRELVRARKLSATVVVQKSSSHEVSALVGRNAAQPIGALRVPVILAAAMRSKKFTAATVMDRETGERLRSLAARNPTRATQILLDLGLSIPAILELSMNAGWPRELDGTKLVTGNLALTPLAVSSMLATFASNGVRRLPQVVRAVGDEPEPDAVRATFTAISPEESWLVASLLPRAGRGVGLSSGGWLGAFTPDVAVAVFVEGARPEAAVSLGLAVLALAQPGGARPFARPPSLVSRDGEWFLPGTEIVR